MICICSHIYLYVSQTTSKIEKRNPPLSGNRDGRMTNQLEKEWSRV